MNIKKETEKLIKVYAEIGYSYVRNEPIQTTFEKAMKNDSYSSYVIGRVLISWMGELDPDMRDEAWNLGIAWLEEVLEKYPGEPGYHEAMVYLRQCFDPSYLPAPNVEAWYRKDKARSDEYLEKLIKDNPAYILYKAVTDIKDKDRFEEILDVIRNYYKEYGEKDLRAYPYDLIRTESDAAFLGNVLMSRGCREEAFYCWKIASRLFDYKNYSNYTYALFYNLAWCYGYGEIVEKDLEAGRKYFDTALWIADHLAMEATDPDHLMELYEVKR